MEYDKLELVKQIKCNVFRIKGESEDVANDITCNGELIRQENPSSQNGDYIVVIDNKDKVLGIYKRYPTEKLEKNEMLKDINTGDFMWWNRILDLRNAGLYVDIDE